MRKTMRAQLFIAGIVIGALCAALLMITSEHTGQQASAYAVLESETGPNPLFSDVFWNHMPLTYWIDEGSCTGTSCLLFYDKARQAVSWYNTQFDGAISLTEAAQAEDADIIFRPMNMPLSHGVMRVGEALCVSAAVQPEEGRTQLQQCVIPYYRLDGCFIPVTIIHEIGHTLGLQHITTELNNLMNPFAINCFSSFNREQINFLKRTYAPTRRTPLPIEKTADEQKPRANTGILGLLRPAQRQVG